MQLNLVVSLWVRTGNQIPEKPTVQPSAPQSGCWVNVCINEHGLKIKKKRQLSFLEGLRVLSVNVGVCGKFDPWARLFMQKSINKSRVQLSKNNCTKKIIYFFLQVYCAQASHLDFSVGICINELIMFWCSVNSKANTDMMEGEFFLLAKISTMMII